MRANSVVDPIELARALIRAPSVTPADKGAMAIVEDALVPLGFACRRMRFGEIENLYARWGDRGPNFCFAGHTDVVPPGDEQDWSAPPFAADVRDGMLIGRGAADMKGAVAAFAAAAARHLAKGAPAGSISLLITGDEEGEAEFGTRAVIEALQAEGERIDHALVGEPTCVAAVGDMIKTGRRGSFQAEIESVGVQGHVAYPDKAANPVPPLLLLLNAVLSRDLGGPYPGFPPSHLEITTVDVGNPARNVIPARARAAFNIRFNPALSGDELGAWLEAEAEKASRGFAGKLELAWRENAQPFATEPGAFTELVAQAVERACGRRPELSTTGGTSDARFLRRVCPVVELGLVGTSMHKVDEQVPVADIGALTAAYEAILAAYFADPPSS